MKKTILSLIIFITAINFAFSQSKNNEIPFNMGIYGGLNFNFHTPSFTYGVYDFNNNLVGNMVHTNNSNSLGGLFIKPNAPNSIHLDFVVSCMSAVRIMVGMFILFSLRRCNTSSPFILGINKSHSMQAGLFSLILLIKSKANLFSKITSQPFSPV